MKPYEQQLSAGSQMPYIFDKDLGQITEHKLDALLGFSPVAILLGSNDLAKNFVLREDNTKDGIDWVELTPKAKDTQFQHIAIGFRSGESQRMELRDALRNATSLMLSNVQKDPQLPANMFRFTPPKGADVIEQ